MNEIQRETVLFWVTIANIVLGITVVVLGTMALVALKECRRMKHELSRRQPSKELVQWHHRPQALLPTRPVPVIKPSVLAENRRRFADDLWG